MIEIGNIDATFVVLQDDEEFTVFIAPSPAAREALTTSGPTTRAQLESALEIIYLVWFDNDGQLHELEFPPDLGKHPRARAVHSIPVVQPALPPTYRG